MIRKTMRVGDVRTSIKLESEFWVYLREIAIGRGMRVSRLVNEIASASPDRTNLASTLRTFALIHAKLRSQTLEDETRKLMLVGNGLDLGLMIDACPLPSLMLDSDRAVRQANRAFSQWLNLEQPAIIGQRLDNIMILRGSGMREMWPGLAEGRIARAAFNATYVSPGKVRTAQALAVGLSVNGHPARRGAVVMFETLAGRG